MNLLALILAHLLYDFHWQGAFISEWKAKSWFLLGVHALTWALCISAMLYLGFGGFAFWKLAFLFATHFGIDAWKSRYTKLAPLGIALWIDQFLHLVTLCIVAQGGF